jgi:hypothetical protein
VVSLWRVLAIHAPRPALLSFAVPAALLPLVSAAAVGALQYRAALRRIGETGSGGLAAVRDASVEWTTGLFAGAVVALTVLAAAAIRARRSTAGVSLPPAGSASGRPTTVGLVSALIAVAVVLWAAERVVVGVVAPMMPADIVGPSLSDGWATAVSRDLSIAVYGGLTLLAALVLWLVATRVRPPVAGAPPPFRFVLTLVVVAMGTSAWYAVHVQAVTRMIAGLGR